MATINATASTNAAPPSFLERQVEQLTNEFQDQDEEIERESFAIAKLKDLNEELLRNKLLLQLEYLHAQKGQADAEMELVMVQKDVLLNKSGTS